MITWASKADHIKLERIRKLVKMAKADLEEPRTEVQYHVNECEEQWIRCLEDILDD